MGGGGKRVFMGSNEGMFFDREPILVVDVDRWKVIAELKNDFIKHGKIPVPTSYLPKEVIDSWILSKQNNVNHESWPPADISEDKVKIILEENKLLIETARPYMSFSVPILEESDYNMILYDVNGIILDFARRRAGEALSVGGDRREKTVGTNAHNLAARYKCPVQIMGAVCYCSALEPNIVSSAPILNEYGELLGMVVLYQEKAANLYNLGHSLAWITSVTMAISYQMRLYRRDVRLCIMNKTLNTTIGSAKDIFISIDNAGHIINYNDSAAKLLNLKDKPKTLFGDLLLEPTALKNLSRDNSHVSRHIAFKNNPDKTFNADITSFADGALIQIMIDSEAEKKGKITFEDIIYKSEAMRELIHKAKRVSKNPVNILLQGESGTGKELFAQAIHNSRGAGPFVAINCASIPVGLIESELFGYEKGAFTGAEKEGRKGKIEYADGGTLFLDEIGDMPLEFQPALLRVLEERKVVRVGGHKSIPVDFRIISATNRFLYERAENGFFRGDLYFRLSAISLEIPPLREREGDVILLAERFIKDICGRFGLPCYSLSNEAKSIMLNYAWPGNVRQLKNAMMYAVSFAEGNTINVCDLPKEIISSSGDCHKMMTAIENMQTEVLKNSINSSSSMEEAAKKLGISRSTLYRRLRNKK